MTGTKRAGRIVVWPTMSMAADAVTPESECVGRLVVWDTTAEAAAHMTLGGGAYTAQAVHFDGASSLHTASLTAPGDATGYCTYSIWFKGLNAPGVLWVIDPAVSYSCNAFCTGGPGEHKIQSAFWDAGSLNTLQILPPDIINETDWHNMLVSVQTNHGVGTKIRQMYLDDVLALNVIPVPDDHPAFLMTFDGLPFMFADDGYDDQWVGDFADFWMAPGQFIDFSVEANRRKFISADGKPVDLGADGSTPTGTAPAVFFSGAASEFATNKGTGGVFTLTGTLTDADASESVEVAPVGLPAWLPDGARAHLDFIEGNYYSGGSEISDLSTVLTDTGVDVGGLIVIDGMAEILGPMLEDMKFPCTIYVHADEVNASTLSGLIALYNDALPLKYGGFNYEYAYITSDDYDTLYLQTTEVPAANGEHKIAARISVSDIGFACDGVAAVADTSVTVVYAPSEIAGVRLNASATSRIKAITVYDALLSDAELEALTT